MNVNSHSTQLKKCVLQITINPFILAVEEWETNCVICACAWLSPQSRTWTQEFKQVPTLPTTTTECILHSSYSLLLTDGDVIAVVVGVPRSGQEVYTPSVHCLMARHAEFIMNSGGGSDLF